MWNFTKEHVHAVLEGVSAENIATTICDLKSVRMSHWNTQNYTICCGISKMVTEFSKYFTFFPGNWRHELQIGDKYLSCKMWH